MSIGQMREFSIKSGNWTGYVERLEMYFLVNKVSDDLKLPTLISTVGEETYELLSTLASPRKPSELQYKTAVVLLSAHLEPKPSRLAERFKFRQRRQLSNESVADYIAELKRLAKTCQFGSTLEDNLCDQLVCGLNSEIIRQRLFAESSVDYNSAVALALSLEAAERNALAVEDNMREISQGVHKMNVSVCLKCGDNRHRSNECIYKDYECSACHEIGHLRRMCPMKYRKNGGGGGGDAGYNNWKRVHSAGEQPGARGGRVQVESARGGGGGDRWSGPGRGRGGGGGQRAGVRRGWRSGRGGGTPARMHLVEEQATNSGGGDCSDDAYIYDDDIELDDEQPMFQMSLSNYKPVRITLQVQNCLLKMEVDTGSALSCISKRVYDELFSLIELKTCSLNIKFYDGSTIQPLGFIEVIVNYKNVTKKLDLYVINKGTTNLLGRQWLAELNISVNVQKQMSSLQSYHISSSCREIDRNKYVNEIISRHEALFDGTLGRYTGGEARLCVREGAVPIFMRARPLPYALRSRVDAELDAMLAAGVVEPVDHSDWATPLVVVRKADGGLRLCADYKVTLNRVLAIDRFPIPKVEDLFSNLSGNKFFTKLDLSQAYNQIVLSESSQHFTVINTHRGLMKYNRLVYGLSSSPGIFQKLMENMLKNVPSVMVFYDDILIKSRDLESHLQSINQVLSILGNNGMKIKKSKCEFLSTEVKYLGFIIDESGVRVDPEKVRAIVTMPHPGNVSELKSFIGMVNFYGKFIRNLSSLLTPLYELLKKGKHWYWGSEQQTVFIKVKEYLCSAEALAHFDMSQETVLTVDASSRGLGAVLTQRCPGGGGGVRGDERVVAYASRTLNAHELNYSQIHKEALAIIFAVDKFHQYLYGRKFILRTDHKPLVSIFGPSMGIPNAAASRLQRWAIKLSAYDFDIEYVRTDKNTADVLSRLIESQKMEVASMEQELPEQTYLHFSSEALLLDYNVLKKETSSDPILSRVLSYVIDGWPADIDIRELQPYANRKSEIYSELGCLMWGHRVIIPPACRKRVMSELHDAHMGMVKTKSLARSYVWWPGIDEAIEATCRACEVCAAVADAPPSNAPHSWPWPRRPWSRIHLDFLGPIGGRMYLVVVDACSKWIEAIRMMRTTALSVIAVLRDLWAKFGIPRQIVSDNGPPFSSTEFHNFLQHNGVDHIFTAPYHPASNGAAESAVKICKRAIKKALKQNIDIDTALCRFLLTYRNTEHAATGDSPAGILLGRRLRMRLDNLKPDREYRVQVKQKKSEAYASGSERAFDPGSDVWYRDYRGSDKWLAGTIIKQLGTTDYSVKSSLGQQIHRHIDQLKKRVTKNNNNLAKTGNKILAWPLTSGEVSNREGSDSGRSSVAIISTPSNPVDTITTPASVNMPNVSSLTSNLDSEIINCKRVRKPPVRYGFEEID